MPVQAIRRFSEYQYRQALGSWAWLDLGNLTPRMASPFGDVFFESAAGWWFLDTLEGKLSQVWRSGQELQAVLNTPEGQDQYLLLGLAQEAESQGLTPGESQVYSLTVPPVLGGPVAVENVSVVDFVVAIDTAGQIHDQVRNLPPGTPVAGLSIS
jgi:hypothetical protein